MRTNFGSRIAGSKRPGQVVSLLVAVLLVVAFGAVPSTGAAPAGGPGSAPPPGGTAPSTPGAGATHSVTLLTGDVVALQVTPGGQQSAWIQRPAHPDGTQRPAQIYEQDGQIHVVPAEAAPYLASGVLDANLFNITLLVDEGFSDQARGTLPLLVQSRSGPSAAAVPATPNGARRVRALDSIAAVSVSADKSRIRSVWDSLRGPHTAAFNSRTARLATAGKVWLNGIVHATAQQGVSQIGAPEAWAAGYDGTGVHVAVLDTGYDPTHPDLAGRVTEERNFTAEADPPGETAIDGNGHGTHVAATIAGSGKASRGKYEGVAPGADLWIGKVLDSNGNGSDDQIIAGMQWAADSGADVINMSLGSPFPSDGTDPMSQAVDQLSKSSGALFVVAAGNAGPDEQTIAAPGSADEALTVGAVDSDDAAASFSSRGPRRGDMAIKPEIVAPGVDIVSARAAGTSLGNLIGRYYTSLSGTSMATPHVAGSAALLAQEHPGWDGAELKAQLVASSKNLPGEPVSFQGAGRVDVASAVRDAVTVDHAALSVGRVTQNGEAVTRTLTYTNPTDRAVRLRLSTNVRGTGVDSKVQPDLSVNHRNLTVPAHGTAHVVLTLSPRDTKAGVYAGDLDADVVAGHRRYDVHSVISFAIDGPLYTLTVNAVDRAGDPAEGPVDLWNEGSGTYQRVWLEDGTATAQVADGTYTMMASIQDSPFLSRTLTVAGNPQLSINHDRTVDLDARDGTRADVDTPRRTDLNDFRVLWSRSNGDRSLSVEEPSGRNGQQLYVIPSKKARRGTFDFATQWQLVQPMLTVRTSGPHGTRISPDPVFASLQDPFVGHKALSVVSAGAGTADDFGAVDARGKIALVTRSDAGLAAQVSAAKAAGVALLLVQNTGTDLWSPDVFRQGLPTYLLARSAGDRLRQELAADPGLTLDARGVQDPTYAYELAYPAQQLPGNPHYQVDPRALATVVSDFRQNSARMGDYESWVPYVDGIGVGNAMVLGRNGPVVRTDYLSTRGVSWQTFGQPDQYADVSVVSGVRRFQPGDTAHQLWWGPLVHPGVPPISGIEQYGSPVARFHDAIRIRIPEYFYGDSRYGYAQGQLGDTSQLELRRGGEVVGKAPTSIAQFSVPAQRAEYELSLSVHRGADTFADTSTATESTWRFESARAPLDGAVLPLVQLDYDVHANGFNEVPAGSSYPLVINPGYQPDASGPGRFRVAVQVSYDDGTSWSLAHVRSEHGRFRAMLPAAAAPGFATVRVVATDAAGNQLTQRIDRAWRIGS